MESSGGIADDLLKAFSAADFEAMRSLLAEDLVAFITNAEGGLDRVEGREEYLSRVEAMDLPSARFSVELTQAPVAGGFRSGLGDGRGPCRARRQSLHNFAAHLLRVADGRVTEWRMVEAKPAESDEFWS